MIWRRAWPWHHVSTPLGKCTSITLTLTRIAWGEVRNNDSRNSRQTKKAQLRYRRSLHNSGRHLSSRSHSHPSGHLPLCQSESRRAYREPCLRLLSLLRFQWGSMFYIKARNPICSLLSNFVEKGRLALSKVSCLLGKAISPPFATLLSQLHKSFFRRISLGFYFKLWDSLHFWFALKM